MSPIDHFNEILIFFTFIIAISLFLDFSGHKDMTKITIANSICWSVFWLIMAFIFYGFIYIEFGKEWANLYLVGYMLEKTLSFDNLMVFIAIFSAFGVNALLERKILFWGIFGAVIFRGLFVFVGTSLYQASSWVELIFAIFIFWTAIKMLTREKNVEINNNTNFSNHWSVRFIGKFLPIYPKFYGNSFFVTNKELTTNNLTSLVTTSGKFYITPAFICLILIESSDIAFAFDSVPAIIAITQEPILVYAAIIFAIIGLRSLYFVLAILAKFLVYLEMTVIILLFFIAIKMLLQFWNHTISDTGYNISPTQSLVIVLSILGIGIVSSVLAGKRSSQKR